MGFIESNIFWIVVSIAVIYIGQDLYRSRKDLEPEKVKASLERFGNALDGVGWKEFVWGFAIFLLVFFLARGSLIVQNEMQECSVWIEQNPLASQYSLDVDLVKYMNDFSYIDQNRSYNYYLRWFNAHGGRASSVSIVCNFSFNLERFKKNVLLDYNERRQWYGK